MIIKSLKVRNGASWSIIFNAIPHISIEQQQSEQQVFDLERCQKQKIITRKMNKTFASIKIKAFRLLFIYHRSSAAWLSGSCCREHDCKLKQTPSPNWQGEINQNRFVSNLLVLEGVEELNDVCCGTFDIDLCYYLVTWWE